METLAMSEVAVKRAAGGIGGGGGRDDHEGLVAPEVGPIPLAVCALLTPKALGWQHSRGAVHHCFLIGAWLPLKHQILACVGTSEVAEVFTASEALDSDAVVAFVRALAAISLDELRDATAPRVFSLTKIVEAAHYNMGRIRWVEGRLRGLSRLLSAPT